MKSILKLYFVLNLATTLALAKPQYQSGTNGFGAGGQTNQFGSQENIPTTYSKKWLKITQKANFYGWASEASETIRYSSANHSLLLFHKTLLHRY